LKPTVALIAAVAENGVIGVDGGMPWRLSTDMKRFKALTVGKPVIMGRKTYESLGKPLPERTNIVVSRQPDFAPDGVVVAGNLAEALEKAGPVDEIMVIGGGELYRGAMNEADRLYITHVAVRPAGDTVFPAIDPQIWRVVRAEEVPVGPRDSAATRFAVYQRASPARG
jgi:dihydrofolate reductase